MQPDDSSISGATRLYRRLHPTQLVWDDNEGRLRPTSNAFKGEVLSVNIGDEMERRGLGIDFVLRFDPNHHLASVAAALARELQQHVWREPLVGHPKYGDDPTHGNVEGRKKGARASAFAKQAEVDLIRPESLAPDDRARWEQNQA